MPYMKQITFRLLKVKRVRFGGEGKIAPTCSEAGNGVLLDAE
jgi:hypothetical protein